MLPPRRLRLNKAVRDPIPYYMLMLDKVRRQAHDFDIIHFHMDQFHFPIFRDIAQRTITTLHGRQDLPDMFPLYAGFPEMRLVSISNAQRKPIPDCLLSRPPIYHGLPRDLLTPDAEAARRLSRLHRPHLAREARRSRHSHRPRRRHSAEDRSQGRSRRSRVLQDRRSSRCSSGADVEFIGEIDERRKPSFLGEARGLLFPIDWPEPFGLVMIEAMACGTPVLAFRHGSVPEVIDEGVTGFVVDSEEEAVRKLGALLALDRGRVRRRFEERFTASRMAADYLKLYKSLIPMPAERRALRLVSGDLR